MTSGPEATVADGAPRQRGTRSVETLFAAARAGDRAAGARLLSLVERGGDEARAVGRAAAPLASAAYTVGITGSPGAGKSTLTSAVIGRVRAAGDRVAVLAIDPTSPFTGGAILGDRVRMQDHATDEGVFIRSPSGTDWCCSRRWASVRWRWRWPGGPTPRSWW